MSHGHYRKRDPALEPTTQVPPLLLAMADELPRGGVWTRKRREAWLLAMEVLLALVYDIEGIKDLRGQSVREVCRDDSVIITGAEYLRKSRLASELEFSKPEPNGEGLEQDSSSSFVGDREQTK